MHSCETSRASPVLVTIQLNCLRMAVSLSTQAGVFILCKQAAPLKLQSLTKSFLPKQPTHNSNCFGKKMRRKACKGCAKKVISLLLGFVESLLFLALHYGWPSLVYVLENEGLFSDLCSDLDSTAHGKLNASTNGSHYFPGVEWTDEVTNASSNGNATISRCQSRDQMMSWVYITGQITSVIAAAAVGLLFDKLGFLAIRTIARYAKVYTY